MYFYDNDPSGGHPGLGQASRFTPAWKTKQRLVPTQQYLRFMTLDQFDLSKSVLTLRLRKMAAQLAQHVRLSWKTMKPIGLVRLIGHTDSSGPEGFNIGLGDRRAQAVKDFLDNLLKGDILSKRVRVAIVTEPSPGKSSPIADNRTAAGMARNRRVEVFIAPPEPPAEPIAPPPPPPPPPVPGDDTKRRIIERDEETRYNKPIPKPVDHKSLKKWFDQKLADHHVPKFVRDKIWDAIWGKNFSLVGSLLGAAGFAGSEKEALLQTARQLAESSAP